ncbi:hypothetical protein ACMD2_02109 [Ananas comosus]|uniref:Secreted protein n=1 Tax=Ananas comosus TaxID=4615 RepID=A0A199UPV1_ANACO|nr:hypothetical protein ACMD2_02109 [Ananas comosus]
MRSASRMVASLCATIIVVARFDAFLNASCTYFSDSRSSALLASSSNKILDRFSMARAIAILCFCPPDS